jgi:AsmA-like C-terminal region
MQSDSGLEKRLNFAIEKLRLNGVEARTVALEFASSLSGFEIKKFSAASIEGAKVNGQGLVLQGADGPTGDFKLNLAADNPRGVLKLAGAIPRGTSPVWTEVLGPTNLQGSISVRPGPAVPLVTYELSGKTGTISFNAVGDVKDLGNATNFGVSSDVMADEGTDLFSLFGMQTKAKSGQPGKLIFTATGAPEVGYKADIKAELVDSKIEYNGNIAMASIIPSLKGLIKFESENPTQLAAVMGLPIQGNVAGPLNLSANIAPNDKGLNFENLAAKFNQNNISGQLQVAFDGGISADMAVPSLDFKNLIAASLLPWNGQAPRFDSTFAEFKSTAKSEIWLRPERLITGMGADFTEAVIGIALGPTARNISLAARGADGEPFKLELGLRPNGTSFDFSGTGHGSLDLAKNLKTVDGKQVVTGAVILDGHFAGQGRSLEGVFAGLNGEGNYILRGAKLTTISPQGFFKRVSGIKDATALQAAFDGLVEGNGMALSAEQLPFKISDGVISIQPLKITNEDTNILVQPHFDLTTNDFKGDIAIASATHQDFPEMHITYSGEPLGLQRRADTAALSSKLGFAIIAKDIAELDRVQAEQKKLVANEEAQRKADEEKFAAFQAQRNELRLRQRELRVHFAQRELNASRFKNELDKAVAAGQVMKKLDFERFLRLNQTP